VWLRARYIARKIPDSRGASPTETVESSDSDTRTILLQSFDHGEVGSILADESIFFVTAAANLGTEISGGGMNITSENISANLTGCRDPGSERDQGAP
jgi:hypothetical protein